MGKLIDLTGQTFGYLTILSYSGFDKVSKRGSWNCLCVCGKKFTRKTHELMQSKKKNSVISCSCMKGVKTRKNAIGLVYNRLTVLSSIGTIKGCQYVTCTCSCGSINIYKLNSLQSNTIKSCGCLSKETRIKSGILLGKLPKIIKHGLSNSFEYKIYLGIKKRCYNKKCESYIWYGARGIYLCDEWKNSFEQFYIDMGPRPSNKHSIDRINNNGPYCKENCRWATTIEQANNTRANHFIIHNGHKKTISQWSTIYGISQSLIWSRVKSGKSLDEIFSKTTLYKKRDKDIKGRFL